MRFELKTMYNHDRNVDGSARVSRCPGCWDVIFDEDAPLRPMIRCNECGETRTATFPGVLNANPR